MRRKRIYILFFINLCLSVLFFNNIFCELTYGQKRAIIINAEAAVESNGTCYASIGDGNGEVLIVQNGTIVNKDVLYMCGATDADFAQWESLAASDGENDSESTSATTDNSVQSDTNNSSAQNNNSSASSNSSQVQNSSKSIYTDEEIEAAWEETNRVESTCTKAGYIEYTNSLTKETKTEELELAKHQYEETERTEPTCTEEGTVTYTCSVCGNTYDETLPATGHSYEWATTKEAGLFTDGLEEEVCSVCGEKSGATHTLSAKCPIPIVGLVGLLIIACGGIAGLIFYKKKKKILQ